jgi:hypothetical protein
MVVLWQLYFIATAWTVVEMLLGRVTNNRVQIVWSGVIITNYTAIILPLLMLCEYYFGSTLNN